MVHGKSLVKVFGQKLEVFVTKIENFSKKLYNTIRFVVIRSFLLHNLTFYLSEFMPKPTETSKKIKLLKKKNAKSSSFLGKNAKISKFSKKNCKHFKVFGTNSKCLERTANISRFWLVLCCF